MLAKISDNIMEEFKRHNVKSLKQAEFVLKKIEEKMTNDAVLDFVEELIADIEKDKDLLMLYAKLRNMREGVENGKV